MRMQQAHPGHANAASSVNACSNPLLRAASMLECFTLHRAVATCVGALAVLLVMPCRVPTFECDLLILHIREVEGLALPVVPCHVLRVITATRQRKQSLVECATNSAAGIPMTATAIQAARSCHAVPSSGCRKLRARASPDATAHCHIGQDLGGPCGCQMNALWQAEPCRRLHLLDGASPQGGRCQHGESLLGGALER